MAKVVLNNKNSHACTAHSYRSTQNEIIVFNSAQIYTSQNRHTHNRLWLYEFCPGQPGWAGTRRNIHPLTPIMVISHSLSASSIYCNTWHPPCSIHVPDSLFHNLSPSSLRSTSWPGTIHFILRTFLHPIIVFFSQHIPNTTTACSAVVPRLYHLILVSLSTLYLEFYLVVSSHTSI